MRKAVVLAAVVLVLLQAVPAVHADSHSDSGTGSGTGSGSGTLWNEVLEKIPLIQNQFYIADIIKLGLYISGFLIALGAVTVTAGYAIARDRPGEAASLLSRGKQMIKAGFLGILLAGVLPLLIQWFAGQVAPQELPADVPVWST